MTTTSPITLSNFTGLDFNQIIQAQLAAMNLPIATLNSDVVNEQTQITSLGALGANLSLLQSSLTNLQTAANTPPQAVSVDSGASFTATPTGSPVGGVYAVTVNRLATSQLTASQGYVSSSDNIGTGTVTLTVGGVSHQITIDSSNDTLSGLAGAINAAALGINTQVVNTGLPGAPYRLELAANSTGAANAFAVTSSLAGGTVPVFTASQVGPVSLDSVSGTAAPTVGGTYSGSISQAYHFSVVSGGTVGTDPISIAYASDSGESGTINVQSSYTPGSSHTVVDGLTLSLGAGTLNASDKFSVGIFNPTLATAQDAQVQVGNQIVSSSINAVTNAIAGVTLNLSGCGGPSTVTINQDISNESNTVSAFVNTFNSLLSGVTSMTHAVPNQAAPALANNGGIEGMMSNLSQALGTVNLSTLGININNKTGQLQFDSEKFSSNTLANPSATASALTSIHNALNPGVTSALAPTTGLIASETDSIQSQITAQNNQITQLQNQETQQQNALTAEYAVIQAQVLQYQNLQTLLNNQYSSSGSSSSPAPIGSNLTLNG